MKVLFSHAAILLTFPLFQLLHRGAINWLHVMMLTVGVALSALIMTLIRDLIPIAKKNWTAAILISAAGSMIMSTIFALTLLAILSLG